MAVKPEGIFLVNRGKKAMMAMDNKVSATNTPNSPP